MNLRMVFFFGAIIFITSFNLQGQSNHERSFEEIQAEADSLWYKKAYIQLLPILDGLLKKATDENHHRHKVQALIQLHEYEAFYTSDNQKAIQHLIEAMDIADEKELDDLRLKTRSKLMFFHQSTTQDEHQVSLILNEMKNLNKEINSDFYHVVCEQWTAQIIGTKRFLKMPISEEEVKKAVTIVRQTINYFDASNEEHLFYYQQVRRNIIGYFGDYFGYDECLELNKEIEAVAHRMKDPITEIGNLMFESAFLRRFEKYEELITRFKEKEYLLESASHGMAKFYHQAMAESYTNLGDFEKALYSTQKMYSHDPEVNRLAFANKTESIRLQKVSKNLAEERDLLANRNFLITIILSLLIMGFIGLFYVTYKIRLKNFLIESQKLDLQEANNTKIKLFGMLAHDLKRPISSLSEISKKVNYLVTKRDWTTLDNMTNQVEQTIFNLDSMLSNILPWMSSQMKNQSLTKTKVDLVKIINRAKMECELFALDKGVIVKDSQLPLSLFVLGNEDSLLIVIRNILSNAIKYSNQNGVIEISSNVVNKHVQISIRDYGIGIPESILENIFIEYKSLKGTKGEIGNGLGLKLSKDLLISNDGNISIESEVGNGTVVLIALKEA